jgi:hypothetical protein
VISFPARVRVDLLFVSADLNPSRVLALGLSASIFSALYLLVISAHSICLLFLPEPSPLIFLCAPPKGARVLVG